MIGKDTRKPRHAFRPGVDSLEDRLVLSTGVAARVAHLEQVREHRHLLRQHRIEVRQLHRHARHHRLAAATLANPVAPSDAAATTGPTSRDSRAAALQASIETTSFMQNLAAANRNPNQVPIGQVGKRTGRIGLGGATTGTVTNTRTATTVATSGSNLNPNLGTLLSNQFVPNTLTQVGTTQNGTTAALISALNNTNTGTNTLFNTIPTAPGTAANIAGTLFNNTPITPGTISNVTGLVNNGTGNLVNSAAGTLLNSSTGTLVNSGVTAVNNANALLGLNTIGTTAQSNLHPNVGASAVNPFGVNGGVTAVNNANTLLGFNTIGTTAQSNLHPNVGASAANPFGRTTPTTVLNANTLIPTAASNLATSTTPQVVLVGGMPTPFI